MGANLDEFAIIDKFFATAAARNTKNAAVVMGIGDDCAALRLAAGEVLLTSCDTLVAGRHFFPDVAAKTLGHKALAVNLSDLAACAAKPLAFMLALSLPQLDEGWLSEFSSGMLNLAQQFNCQLMGGDTTKGPLSITISVYGCAALTKVLRRSTAKVGDDIYVSGSVGDARAGLEILRHGLAVTPTAADYLVGRLQQPTPRLELGMELGALANSGADISDGLLGDLKHILTASQVGAVVAVEPLLASASWALQQLPLNLRRQFMLAGGDDYELVFTAAPANRQYLAQIAARLGIVLTRIGSVTAAKQLIITQNGLPLTVNYQGYNHFG